MKIFAKELLEFYQAAIDEVNEEIKQSFLGKTVTYRNSWGGKSKGVVVDICYYESDWNPPSFKVTVKKPNDKLHEFWIYDNEHYTNKYFKIVEDE